MIGRFYKSRPGERQPVNPSRPILFIVEGPDDGHFLEEMLTQMDVADNVVDVRDVGGKPNIESYINLTLKSPHARSGDLKKIVIFLDADNDFERAKADFHRVLTKLGLPTPQEGSFGFGGNLEIGFYLFPRSGRSGELEDLIEGVHRNPLLEQSRRFFENSTEGNEVTKPTKRIIQIYLAVVSQPLCAGVGRAIRGGSLQVDVNELEELRDFLNRAVTVPR